MRLSIHGPAGTVLELDDEQQNAILPGDRSERSSAFGMLTEALALLVCAAPPLQSSDATEGVTDERLPQTARDLYDRKSCDVVHLSARRADKAYRSDYLSDFQSEK